MGQPVDAELVLRRKFTWTSMKVRDTIPAFQRHRASELNVEHCQSFELGHGGPRGWQRAAQRIVVKLDRLGVLGVYRVLQTGRHCKLGHAW